MNKCSVSDCNNQVANRKTGLCHKHHLRYVRKGHTDLEHHINTSEKCDVNGCERTKISKTGHCLMHYKRLVRTGSTDLPEVLPKLCTYCDDIAIANGLCTRHYQMMYRHGDALYVEKKRASVNRYGYTKAAGKYRVLHREVMANFLGRDILPEELVHHLDLNKTNNNISNLILCDASTHMELHNRLETLAAEFYKIGFIFFDGETYQINSELFQQWRNNER